MRCQNTGQPADITYVGLALLGLRNDNSPEYMEKQANIAKDIMTLRAIGRTQ